MKLRILVTLISLAVLAGCQWMFELGTPGGYTTFKGLSPKVATDSYMQIVQYLQTIGFTPVPTSSPESARPFNSLYSNRSGYFKDYIFREASRPYLIGLQLDMDVSHTKISYQYHEYERVGTDHMRVLGNQLFSPEGCQIVSEVYAFVLARLGEDHIDINGVPNCGNHKN